MIKQAIFYTRTLIEKIEELTEAVCTLCELIALLSGKEIVWDKPRKGGETNE